MSEPTSLQPKLVSHWEQAQAEADKMSELATQSLARIALLYGNQLSFDFNGTKS